MEYYTARKRDKSLPNAAQMNLTEIMFSKRSQTQKVYPV